MAPPGFVPREPHGGRSSRVVFPGHPARLLFGATDEYIPGVPAMPDLNDGELLELRVLLRHTIAIDP